MGRARGSTTSAAQTRRRSSATASSPAPTTFYRAPRPGDEVQVLLSDKLVKGFTEDYAFAHEDNAAIGERAAALMASGATSVTARYSGGSGNSFYVKQVRPEGGGRTIRCFNADDVVEVRCPDLIGTDEGVCFAATDLQLEPLEGTQSSS